MILLSKNPKKAVTLIEMMVVMAIISIVLGISSAFLSQFNKRLALKGAGQEISSLLRLAKNYAIESKNKSHFTIEEQSFVVKGNKIRGYWHLEKIVNDQSQGFGLPANIKNGKLVRGKIGNAIHLDSEGVVDCGEAGYFELGTQFVISFWVFMDTVKNSNRSILSIGDSCSLQLKPDHNFSLNLYGSAPIETKNFILPLFQWVQIQVKCENNIVQIFANNIEVLKKQLQENLAVPYDSHVIFGKDSPFRLDEIGIFSFVELERYELPQHIFVEKEASISFHESGRLHPLDHISAVTILIKEKRTEQILAIETSLMGNFTVADESNGK